MFWLLRDRAANLVELPVAGMPKFFWQANLNLSAERQTTSAGVLPAPVISHSVQPVIIYFVPIVHNST